jgi:hypothetical protein
MPANADNLSKPPAVDTGAPVPASPVAVGGGAGLSGRIVGMLAQLPPGKSRGVSTIAKAISADKDAVAAACKELRAAGRLNKHSGRGERYSLKAQPQGGTAEKAKPEAAPREAASGGFLPPPSRPATGPEPARRRPGAPRRLDGGGGAPEQSDAERDYDSAPRGPEPGAIAGDAGGIRFSFLVGALCQTALPPPLTPGEVRMIDNAFGEVDLPPWAGQVAVLVGILGPRLARHPLIQAQWAEYRRKRLGKRKPAASQPSRPEPPPKAPTPQPAEPVAEPTPAAPPAKPPARSAAEVADSIDDGAF